MELDTAACYQAMLTRDRRFDGLFFVGVTTTGIYCRPICPARTPYQENVAFYRSAAAAERAGFRPCLRCRPELAPGRAPMDATERLAASAASRIEDGALTEGSVETLAAELGVSGRHLRRIVEGAFGVSPVELAQTQRLLLAKRLLADSDLSIADVAFASGFSSLRRFNALFRERYRLNPSELRKGRASEAAQTFLACELPYHAPFDWHTLTAFLAGRASSGTEIIHGECYARTAQIGDHRGWFSVAPTPDRDTLTVSVSASLAPVLRPVLARVKRLFDLNADPLPIAARLGPLAEARPGLRVPGAFDGFETAARAILGQQISVRAATTLAGRFASAFGEPIETPIPGLTHLAPNAARVAQAEPETLIPLGIFGTRARAIIALARAVHEGTISLVPGINAEITMQRLRELPGIGEWTAQVIALRALAWPDAFPHTDLGIFKALGETNPKRVLERAEAWRPWRAYAALHLWKSLETNP